MKRKLFFPVLLIALVVAMNSCKLGNDSNYSPRLTLMNPALINTDSTLRMSYTNEGNIKFDSLHVNDTVTISVIGEGFTNNLTAFEYEVANPGDIEVIIPDSIKTFFESRSDFVKGTLYFTPKIVWMNIPFKFVAKKTSDKVKLNFLLESDAKNVSNLYGLQIEFPVKP
ncbi:MAG: hypothetical protein QMB37_06650 [Paludibacteraceae bacterium]